MPGVTYERQVHFTSHGPVAIHVVTAPRPGGAYALKPVLSNGAIVGKARVTAMQASLSRDYTVAGVNGDLFSLGDGRPSGVLIRSGVIDHPPLPERRLVDPLVVPAGGAECVDVGIVDHGGGLGQLLGVVEQCASLRVEFVRAPGRREFGAQVLVSGQAAHGRRVESESGRSVDVAVDDHREHLALKAGEWR